FGYRIVGANGGGAQAVVALGRLKQARLQIGVRAIPRGLPRLAKMPDRGNVADGVVDVTLGIIAHDVAVIRRPTDAHSRCVVVRVWYWRRTNLTEMLATCCFDESIHRVIRVFCSRLHSFVAEVNRLLSIISDAGDV